MYVNKCTKCGAEFETKNPKRVICPNCLYPDKKPDADSNSDTQNNENYQGSYNSYSTEAFQQRERRDDNRPYGQSRYDGQRSYNRPYPQRNYNSGQRRPYDRNDGGYNRGGSYQRQPRPYDRDNRNQKPQGKRPQRQRPAQKKPPKQLLINKEQLLQIEELYKKMLPLPNPDAHEVIGAQIGLEPRKVFFGINLVRQKLMLPKLTYPKRKLAVSPDQLTAIKALYEPLLPLPPIGCHKILAAQLKIDEWRVHVGIGLIRKQMGLDRWNPDREDAPQEFKNQAIQEEKQENTENTENLEKAEAPKKTAKKSKAAVQEAAENEE